MAEGAREGTYTDPGDVGRRVAQRRRELGLTVAEVALRAQTAPEYLEYLETRPGHPTVELLLRLAGVLETTAQELLGGGMERPPGRGSPGRHPRLETLDERECLWLISAGGVGRVAFQTDLGPVVLPVNFAVVDGAIVFRTAADTAQASHADGEVGFEVDHLDEAMREGWSVLIVGPALIVTEPAELQRIREQGHVGAWAGGERDLYVRIDPVRVTGRRIHADQRRR